MNKLKRTIALLLAGILCMSMALNPIDSKAEEIDSNNECNVTFDVSAGGKLGVSDDAHNVYEVTADDSDPLNLTVEKGESLHFELIADTGYEVSAYYILDEDGNSKESEEDANILNADGTYKKNIVISDNSIIKVIFNEKTTDEVDQENVSKFKVYLNSSDNGTVFLNEEEVSEAVYASGEEVCIVAIPNDGYIVRSLSATKEDGSDNGIEAVRGCYITTVSDSDVTINVSFEPEPIGRKWITGENLGTAVINDPNGISLFSTVGSNCTITPGQYHSYGSWDTCEFSVTSDSGNHLGFCAEPNSATPSGIFQVSELNNNLIKFALMLAPNGPWEYTLSSEIGKPGLSFFYDTNVSGGNVYANAHAVVGYLYSGQLTGLSPSYSAGVQNMAQSVQNIYNNCGQGTSDAYHTGIDPNDYKVYVAYNNSQDVVWLEHIPQKGKVQLRKTSANPELTNGNSCYSLSGAKYGVYRDRACTSQIATLTTDANGNSNTVEVQAGSYWVKEIMAPKGFALDKQTYPVTVTSGNTSTVNVKDVPQSDPVSIVLGKVDKETNANKPQGSSSLKDAEFTVKYYDVQMDTDPAKSGYTPKRTWVLKTNENGFTRLEDKFLVSGDDFYKLNGVVTLPMGTVTIQETKAPEGYLLNDEVYVRQIKDDGSHAEKVETYNEPTVKEQIIRGDFEIIKVRENEEEDNDTLEGIKGVEFTITDEAGEVVKKIYTDKNGYATTADPNYPDGGLVYGTYTVTETKTPEGLIPIAPFKVTISENNVTLKGIYKEDKLIVSPVTVVKKDKSTGNVIPVKDTEFRLLDSEKNPVTMTTYYPNKVVHETFKTDENGQFTFPDKLKYGTYYLEEVKAPEGYLKGELLEFKVTTGATWENPLIIEYKDENAMGKIIIRKTDAETQELLSGAVYEIFAADDIVTPDGTVRLQKGDVADTVTTQNGKAESKELYLGKYVVKEKSQPQGYILSADEYEVELKYKDQETPVVFENVDATNQPTRIELLKVDKDTGKPLEGVEFKVWNKVNPGMSMAQSYTTDTDGKIIISYLTPGTYCLQETRSIPGYTVDDTVYEITIDNDGRIDGKDVGEIKVTNQHVVLVGTTAKDTVTGTHQSFASEAVTHIDTVELKYLDPEKEYELECIAMDKSTGDPILVDGQKVTLRKSFILGSADGTVDMEMTYDASELEGKAVVYFEYLYEDGVLIASHEDINDDGQTIEFPDIKIGTTAIGKDTGKHEVAAIKNAVIIDKVTYDLIPGLEYTFKGVVVDPKTGEPIIVNGKEIWSEKTVELDEQTGTVEMEFKFDASSLAGKDVVIYEYVYHNDKLITSHEDPNDEGQTVAVKLGKIKTRLPGGNNSGILKTVKTGDSISVIPFIIALITAAIVIFIYIQDKRKKEK